MVNPSICGTAATFSADLPTYCTVSINHSYLFSPLHDLLKEEDVDCVHLRQVCLTLLSEEVVNIPLGLHLLHHLSDVHHLQSESSVFASHLSYYIEF